MQHVFVQMLTDTVKLKKRKSIFLRISKKDIGITDVFFRVHSDYLFLRKSGIWMSFF